MTDFHAVLPPTCRMLIKRLDHADVYSDAKQLNKKKSGDEHFFRSKH